MPSTATSTLGQRFKANVPTGSKSKSLLSHLSDEIKMLISVFMLDQDNAARNDEESDPSKPIRDYAEIAK